MAKPRTDEQLDREIQDAIHLGDEAHERGPRAVDAWYDAASGRVMVELTNGVVFGFPPERAQGLQGASAQHLAAVEVEGNGYGLHWEALDADLTVPGLVAGVFGSEMWMRELGRLGGSATSDAKREAARKNGLMGGRPRKAATSGIVVRNSVHTLPNPYGGGWVNKQSGRVVSQHDRKESAVTKGRELAQSSRGEHTIHRKDGAIAKRQNYGNDPSPPFDRSSKSSSGSKRRVGRGKGSGREK